MTRNTCRSAASRSIALVSLLALGVSGVWGTAITSAAGVVEGVWTDQFLVSHAAFTSSYGFNSNIGASNPAVQSGSVTGGNSYLGAAFSGHASSTADVGVLHVSTDGTLTNEPGNLGGSTFQVESVAHFSDVLTITSPSVGVGQLGFVSFNIDVDGTNTWTSNAFASSYLQVKIGTNSFQTLPISFADGVNGAITLSTGFQQIAFGQVNITVDLYSTDTLCIPCSGALGSPIQASSDFSNTAQLSGAAFQDSSHQTVAASISGDPRFDYTTFAPAASSSAAPEPGTLVLLTLGIAGIVSFKRRT